MLIVGLVQVLQHRVQRLICKPAVVELLLFCSFEELTVLSSQYPLLGFREVVLEEVIPELICHSPRGGTVCSFIHQKFLRA